MLQTAHLEILKSASSKSTAYLRKVANIVYAVFAHCTGKGKFDPNGPQADPCKAEIDHGHQPLQHHQDHHILEQYRVQRVIHLHLLENKKNVFLMSCFMPLDVMHVLVHDPGHPCQDCQGAKASQGQGDLLHAWVDQAECGQV